MKLLTKKEIAAIFRHIYGFFKTIEEIYSRRAEE
jgi:hypothetical protein